MRAMITCASSPIMYDVINLISKIDSIESVLLVDSEVVNLGFENEFIRVPNGDSEEYINVLTEIVKVKHVDFIFVSSDEEAFAISRDKNLWGLTHLDTHKNIALTQDKLKLHESLDISLVPDFVGWQDMDALSDFLNNHDSIIQRPIHGRGSRGLKYIIGSKLKNKKVKIPQGVFLTEFLPGDKYSIDCLFEQGVLYSAMIRNNGKSIKYKSPTMFAQTSVDKDVYDFAVTVGDSLKLSGFHQIECGRSEDNKVKLIEINARLDATLPITMAYKENFYEIILKKEKLGLLRPNKKIFKRYFKAVLG